MTLDPGPALDIAALRGQDKKRWLRLPPDLRAFLAETNGGALTGDRITSYATPCGPAELGEIWCFLPQDRRPPISPTSMLHAHEEHRQLGILPAGVLAFARCLNESLTCISVRKADAGTVFHWEISWQEPHHGDLFVRRLERVQRDHPDMERVLQDARHPQHDEVLGALMMATLLPVAPSFTEWLDGLSED